MHKLRTPERSVKLPVTIDISILFELLKEHIEETEDSQMLLDIVKFLKQELEAWDYRNTDNLNIQAINHILKSI